MMMRCWSCREFFDSNKVKWNPRPISLPIGDGLDTKNLGIDIGNASPNTVFGYEHHEMISKCPKCKKQINCLLSGIDEPKSKNVIICPECEKSVNRLSVSWYSYSIFYGESRSEVMVSVCPYCQQEFAFKNYKPESFTIAESSELSEKGISINRIKNAINNSELDELIEKGNEQFTSHNFEEAISFFDKALEILPNIDYVLYNKGLAFYQLRKNEEAMECYNRILDFHPRYSMAIASKGNLLADSGNHEKAIEHYDRALANDPKNFDALTFKGITLSELGNYEEAISCFDKALEINPEHSPALENKKDALEKLQGN